MLPDWTQALSGPALAGRGLPIFLSEAMKPVALSLSRPPLVTSLNSGRPKLEELYRKYSPSLYWVCLRYTSSPEDAEDVVQQVFIKVHRNLDGFNGLSSIYTWMYRIAVNECIQMFRRRKPERGGKDLPDLEEIAFDPGPAMDAKIMLEKILGFSDPVTREILFLLHMEGLGQEEVAEALNISRSTVNRKLVQFKAMMAKYR